MPTQTSRIGPWNFDMLSETFPIRSGLLFYSQVTESDYFSIQTRIRQFPTFHSSVLRALTASESVEALIALHNNLAIYCSK